MAVTVPCKGKTFDKQHNCYFCNKLQKKISRHLLTVHSDEKIIAKLPSLSKFKKDSECYTIVKEARDHVLYKLEKLGDFEHNIDVLTKGVGTLLVSRRPAKDGKRNPSDYIPCKYCLGFFTRQEAWRHAIHCSCKEQPLTKLKDRRAEKTFTRDCRLVLFGAGVVPTEWQENLSDPTEFYDVILDSLQDGLVAATIKSDPLLKQIGMSWFGKLGRARASEVRGRLRLLGRLKLQLRDMVPPVLKSSDSITKAIAPDKFDAVVAATRKIAGATSGATLNGLMKMARPGSAMKMGQYIKKV